jgi:ABC-type multidrug transport system permease subunit
MILLDKSIYIAQIVALLWCSFMIWKARQATNGLGRGMLLLLFLLILRRVDDAFSILDDTGVLILSSLVVMVIVFDVYQIYKMRGLYALYFANRQERIDELERQYLKSH